MNENILSWEITISEKRKRIKKLIMVIGYPFFVIGITTVMFSYLGMRAVAVNGFKGFFQLFITIVIVLILSIAMMTLVGRFYPFAYRKYILDENGITIIKNKKEKKYIWQQIDFFYMYSKKYGNIKDKNISGIYQADNDIMGEIFYLKKRNTFIAKVFIVVYSEPNNSNSVRNFLSSFIREERMTSMSDLGLIFYKFK